MLQLFEYYGRFQGFRGRLGGLPAWARLLVLIVALPGIVLASLSILLLVVSILALLVLTVPVYRLLVLLTGSAVKGPVNAPEGPEITGQTVVIDSPANEGSNPARRHIDVKIVE